MFMLFGQFFKVKWGLKKWVLNDADSGPLVLVLWCCGSIFHEIFNFIQTDPEHTVCYDSCRGRYYQPILIHFQLATLPKFDYWTIFSAKHKCKLLRNVNYSGLIISKQFRNKPFFQRKSKRLRYNWIIVVCF